MSVAATKVKTAKIVSSSKPKKTEASVPATPLSNYPIVAIGASAGGLEAIEQFLTNVPADSGMAYIVIQHLDPNHKGMLTELLQRITALPVAQIKKSHQSIP